MQGPLLDKQSIRWDYRAQRLAGVQAFTRFTSRGVTAVLHYAFGNCDPRLVFHVCLQIPRNNELSFVCVHSSAIQP